MLVYMHLSMDYRSWKIAKTLQENVNYILPSVLQKPDLRRTNIIRSS